MSTTFIQLREEFINLEQVAHAQLQGPADDPDHQVLLVSLLSGQQFRYEGDKMKALLQILSDRSEVALGGASH